MSSPEQSWAEKQLEREIARSNQPHCGRGYWSPGAIKRRIEEAQRAVCREHIWQALFRPSGAVAPAMSDLYRSTLNLWQQVVDAGLVEDTFRGAQDFSRVLGERVYSAMTVEMERGAACRRASAAAEPAHTRPARSSGGNVIPFRRPEPGPYAGRPTP